MKWIISLLLILSLLLNCYFINDEIKAKQEEEFSKAINKAMGMDATIIPWKAGVEMFTLKLKQSHSKLLNKQYYYVNIWTSWCKPCIKEMPWLDSIAGTLTKDVGYCFVSEVSQSVADSCLKRRKYNLKNFVFMNDMDSFVSAVCAKRGIKNKLYPMSLILNNKNEVIHYSVGAYSNQREAAEFATLINNLK